MHRLCAQAWGLQSGRSISHGSLFLDVGRSLEYSQRAWVISIQVPHNAHAMIFAQ